MVTLRPALFGIHALPVAALLFAAASPGPSDPLDSFLEMEGVQELSGQLIVRPWQPPDLTAIGFVPEESELRTELAIQTVREFEVVEYVPQTDEYILRVPEGSTEAELAGELLATGLFQYAEPDWFLYPQACPNDARFGNQWHHGTGSLGSCDAWDVHTGSPSIVVGICDTGVRRTHEDLQLHRREAYNAASRQWESQGGAVDPINPHGTLTTGCAAANGNNGIGVAGMGWNLGHRMLRVTNDPTGRARMSDLQHAARTSIESGDRVASLSYSGVDKASNLTTATYIKSIGGLLVWSAGNAGQWLGFGNRDNDDVIVVGGTTMTDTRASFSAYGPLVDLMAPAVSILTTGGDDDDHYGGGSGTSYAAPLVAGLCALIWSADPSLTPDDVELILKTTCVDLGPPGADDNFGHGRIDTNAALQTITGISATVTWRNGSGVNPSVFSALTLPRLGTSWRSRINAGAVGATGVTTVYGHVDPTSGLFSAYGELLADVNSFLMVYDVAGITSGLSTHSVWVPNDPLLLGAQVATQGLVFSATQGYQMTNALDLVLGN